MTTTRHGGPPARSMRVATALACHNASWLPLVPSRSSRTRPPFMAFTEAGERRRRPPRDSSGAAWTAAVGRPGASQTRGRAVFRAWKRLDLALACVELRLGEAEQTRDGF